MQNRIIIDHIVLFKLVFTLHIEFDVASQPIWRKMAWQTQRCILNNEGRQSYPIRSTALRIVFSTQLERSSSWNHSIRIL